MEKHRDELNPEVQTAQPRGRKLLIGALTLAVVAAAGLMSSVALANNGQQAKSTCGEKAARACGEKAVSVETPRAGDAVLASTAAGGSCCPSQAKAAAGEPEDAPTCPVTGQKARAAAGEKEDGSCGVAKAACGEAKAACGAEKACCEAGDKDCCPAGKAAKAECGGDDGGCGGEKAAKAGCGGDDGGCGGEKMAKAGCGGDDGGCGGEKAAGASVQADRDYITIAKVSDFLSRMNPRGGEVTAAKAGSSEVEDELAARGCCPGK